jgi:hypothetical protein
MCSYLASFLTHQLLLVKLLIVSSLYKMEDYNMNIDVKINKKGKAIPVTGRGGP